MTGIVVEYHRRFGLGNPDACRAAVETLRGIGYDDEEILHLYSVLTRKPPEAVRDLLGFR
jgi:hypothetical protein